MIVLEQLSSRQYTALLITLVLAMLFIHVPAVMILDPMAPMDLIYAHPPWSQYKPADVSIGNYTPSDQFDYHLPYYTYIVESLRNGDFPTHTTASGNGVPLYFNVTHYAPNPLAIIPGVILGPAKGYTVYIAIKLIVGALSTNWLCRSYGLGRLASLWAVLLLCFSTTSLTALGIPMSGQMFFTVFLMASIRRAFTVGGYDSIIWLSLSSYLVLTSAYPPGVVAALLFSTLYFIYEFFVALEAKALKVKTGIIVGLSAVLCLLLAAPFFLETYRFFSATIEGDINNRVATYAGWALSHHSPILSWFPMLIGDPPGASGPYGLFWFYETNFFGAAGMFLLFFGAWAARRSRAALFFCLSTILYGFINYDLFDIYSRTLGTLPIISGLRAYTHMYMLVISVSFLSAFGLDLIVKTKVSVRIAVLLFAIGGALWSAIIYMSLAGATELQALFAHQNFTPVLYSVLALIALIAAICLNNTMRKYPRILCLYAVVFFTAASLLDASEGVNRTTPKAAFFPDTPETDFLHDNIEDGKVLPLATTLLAQAHLPYNFDTIGITGFFTPRTLDVFNSINPDMPRNTYVMQFLHGAESSIDLSHPFLDVMGIKYITAPSATDLTANEADGSNQTDPNLDLVFDGAVRIYERNSYRGRVFLPQRCVETDGAELLDVIREDRPDLTSTVYKESCAVKALGSGSVEIASESNGRIILDVTLDAPGTILLGDNFYPGWKAAVKNGDHLIVERGNYNFISVDVPEGQTQVVLRYRPNGMTILVLMSSVCWLLWLALLLHQAAKRLLVKSRLTA